MTLSGGSGYLGRLRMRRLRSFWRGRFIGGRRGSQILRPLAKDAIRTKHPRSRIGFGLRILLTRSIWKLLRGTWWKLRGGWMGMGWYAWRGSGPRRLLV